MTRKRRALRKAAPEKNVNNFRDPEASRFDNFKNIAYKRRDAGGLCRGSKSKRFQGNVGFHPLRR